MKSGKTWGHTFEIFNNYNFKICRIFCKKGYQCSKHLHQFKNNLFYCESGEVNIHVFKNDYPLEDITNLKTGEKTNVCPGEKHYFEAMQDSVIYEIYYNEPVSEDIIRDNCGGKVC